jgi:DNA/RNA endonuclease YhcR with UshA esterase domain
MALEFPEETTMRVLPMAAVILFATGLLGSGDDTKPITPEAAAKKINEKCVVEMKVASTGKGNGVYFLNSKENFRDEGNFTIFISKDGVESLQKAKIDDPAAHFKEKTIRVTGTVKLYKERPEIAVDKAEQIQIVEKK